MCRNVSYQAISRLLLRQLPSTSNHIAELPTLPPPILTFSISRLPSLLPPLNHPPSRFQILSCRSVHASRAMPSYHFIETVGPSRILHPMALGTLHCTSTPNLGSFPRVLLLPLHQYHPSIASTTLHPMP